MAELVNAKPKVNLDVCLPFLGKNSFRNFYMGLIAPNCFCWRKLDFALRQLMFSLLFLVLIQVLYMMKILGVV